MSRGGLSRLGAVAGVGVVVVFSASHLAELLPAAAERSLRRPPV